MATPTVDLLGLRLIFVTGKGGTGKSTVAAGLALLNAERGRKTLVCEVDAKGNLTEYFEARPTSFRERELLPNLWAMSMDTEASLRQYLSLQLKLPAVARIGPLAKMFDFVASAAPGVKENVTVGKLCWEVREGHYDTVVVDASASGHIVSQLSAPQAINQLVQVGLVRQQTGWMLDILSDSARTGLVVVATPAEMPVAETLELIERTRSETVVNLAAVVVNRVLPELFGRGEQEVFEQLAGDQEVATGVIGDRAPDLFAAARFSVELRRSRAEHLETLRSRLDPDLEMLYLPYLYFRRPGMRSTRQVAEALAAELGY